MLTDTKEPTETYFTRPGVTRSPSAGLTPIKVISRNPFEHRFDDGRAPCVFPISFLLLDNGEVIPAVSRADQLPWLDEILVDMEPYNARLA